MQWENMKANLQAYFICCVRAKTRLNTSKHGRTVHRRSVRSVKKQRTHRHDMKFPWSALFPCRFIKQSTINSTILLQLCKRTETKRYKWIEDCKHDSIAVKNQSNAQTILNHFSVFMLSHLALFSFMRNEICKKRNRNAYKTIKSFQHRHRKQTTGHQIQSRKVSFFRLKCWNQTWSTTKCVFCYFKKNFLPENRAFQCQKRMKIVLKSRKNTSSFPADHAVELITSLTGIAISRDQRMRDVMCNFHLTNYIRNSDIKKWENPFAN